MRDEFWQDLQNEMKWRAAARQLVRLLLISGLTPMDAIVEAIRVSRARGAVLEELRDMAVEVP